MVFIYFVGCFTLALLVYKIMKFGLHLLRFFMIPPADLKKYGEWAIVTGCTDGIGQEYARQLAKQGLNMVLISRTLSKLQATAQEIESEYKVKTKVIAVDFTHTDIYDKIGKEIEGLEIGVLVNNVGMNIPFPQYIGEIEKREEVLLNIINCNVTSVTMMTSLVINNMAERGSGLVINIASISAAAPMPLLSAYAATKSYVNQYSMSVHREYADKGVDIQVILPGYVVSKLSGIKRPSFWAPSPKTFVRSALTTVGHVPRSAGFWFHEIQLLGLDTLTYLSPTFTSKYNMSLLLPIRGKALKKRKEQAEKQD